MEDIVKKQKEKDSMLRDEDGVLVFAGRAIGDIVNAIREQREEHLRILSILGQTKNQNT